MIKAIITEPKSLEIPIVNKEQLPKKSIFSDPLLVKLESLEAQLRDILSQKNISSEIKMRIYHTLLTKAREVDSFRKKGARIKFAPSYKIDNTNSIENEDKHIKDEKKHIIIKKVKKRIKKHHYTRQKKKNKNTLYTNASQLFSDYP